MNALLRGKPSRPVLIAGSVWIVLALAASTSGWRLWELKGFDLWSRLGARPPVDAGITIVGIDEPSFAELQLQWPWPRSLHARLIDQLQRAGAAVIAFDVVFAEASNPAEDAALAEAIARSGHVVLASDLATQETTYAQQVMQIEPLLAFRQAGALQGLAAVSLDGDMVLRRVPRAPEAFWRAILRQDPRADRRALADRPVDDRALIRYAGPDHAFPYVSYYQALDPDTFLRPGSLKGRVVLVGRDVKTSPELGAAQADLFGTPFSAVTGLLTPGVEVHANILETMATGRAIQEVGRLAALSLLALVVAMAAWTMRHWRPIASAALGLALALVWLAATWWLFDRWDRWVPALAPLSGIAFVYVAQGGVAFLEEQTRRRQIKLAFGYYVSPAVVEEMVAHPERLVLGGERRVLTTMFADIAGFTSLAETITAEETAHILNELLTAMTDIVLRYGGTVDKFLGDAIMAFWNAPLDDPEHALHACQAAVDMQADLQRRRDEAAARHQVGLRMRIGITSGSAVVGNIGSATRFDYSAIGDSVNLASRLEGVNKLYGTATLLTEATAVEMNGRLPLRRIDRVRVKGKAQPVELFTLDADPAIVPLNEQAIDAYRRQEWDSAAASWRAVLAVVPDDPVALVYLERIETYRLSPPGDGWDGSIALEKM